MSSLWVPDVSIGEKILRSALIYLFMLVAFKLTGGLIGAVTILALNYGVVELTYRSRRARRVLEPAPTVLVHNGLVLHENLARERITMDDLLAALRRNGVLTPSEARPQSPSASPPGAA